MNLPIVKTLFESFCQLLDNLPPKGIFKAAEIERLMLEDDLAHGRILSMADAVSVLNFCHFLKAVSGGTNISWTTSPPMEHIECYRRILDKLIEAGELSADARERFNNTFSTPPALKLAV